MVRLVGVEAVVGHKPGRALPARRLGVDAVEPALVPYQAARACLGRAGLEASHEGQRRHTVLQAQQVLAFPGVRLVLKRADQPHAVRVLLHAALLEADDRLDLPLGVDLRRADPVMVPTTH